MDTVLLRLHGINPNFRLTWTPPEEPRMVDEPDKPTTLTGGRPALWWVHEVRPNNPIDELRKAAGKSRLDRWNRATQAYREMNPATPAQCRDWMAGYHTIGSWPDGPIEHKDQNGVVQNVTPGFGSDRFFEELLEGIQAINNTLGQLELDRRLNDAGEEKLADEAEVNPDFRQLCRDVADHYHAGIFRGRVGVLVDGLKGGPHDNAHG